MIIKIFDKNQLILLRNLSPMIKKKYRLPREIFDKIEVVLASDTLGRTGFVAVVLEPLTSGNDATQIQDILNFYPHQLKMQDNIQNLSVKEQDTWLTKGREWFMDAWKVKRESSYIYIIYSMMLDTLYGGR